jgi:hypothetical protein
MLETCPEKREQAMALIRVYCRRPFRDHGTKRSSGPYKGWHLHDWGHIVQRVYRMYYDLPLDIPSATLAAKLVRSEFPNRNDWEKRVSSNGAQTRMLELIEEGIAPFSPAAAAQPD